jgi:hypothetical protein
LHRLCLSFVFLDHCVACVCHLSSVHCIACVCPISFLSIVLPVFVLCLS